MVKQILINLVLDISDEMFEKIAQGLTEEQKKYMEFGKMIPSPGMCFWNDTFVTFMKKNIIPLGKEFLEEFLQDLEKNDRTCH